MHSILRKKNVGIRFNFKRNGHSGTGSSFFRFYLFYENEIEKYAVRIAAVHLGPFLRFIPSIRILQMFGQWEKLRHNIHKRTADTCNPFFHMLL